MTEYEYLSKAISALDREEIGKYDENEIPI